MLHVLVAVAPVAQTFELLACSAGEAPALDLSAALDFEPRFLMKAADYAR